MSKAKFKTPKGTAVWPWFSVPDTRYNADGVYKTDLILSKEEAKPLMAKAKEIYIEEFGEKATSSAHWPFKFDEENGGVVFRAKSSKKPVLYDGKGSVINDTLNVGTGSVIKLAGVMSTYDAGGNKGVTMYLNAAQIIKLEEFGGESFEAEDDAYVHAATDAEPEQASDDSSDNFDF